MPITSVALSNKRYILYRNANGFTIISPENIEKFVQVINKNQEIHITIA